MGGIGNMHFLLYNRLGKLIYVNYLSNLNVLDRFCRNLFGNYNI